MPPFTFRDFLLLLLSSLVIFYLIIAGVNLGLRLTATRQPECNPVFCKAIVDEASYCLITTPDADSCLKISGFFFVVSKNLAYILLLISFGLSYLIYKKLYLSRVLISLLILALLVFSVRVFLGAASFSVYGIIYEFQKLGLY